MNDKVTALVGKYHHLECKGKGLHWNRNKYTHYNTNSSRNIVMKSVSFNNGTDYKKKMAMCVKDESISV